MAGGEGTRLRPITCGIPKPMIDVMGIPVMEHIILLMKNAGITEIAVTLMYMPHIIKEYFGDGSSFGVNIYYFTEETPLGTAGSVKNAQEFLNDDFIIISGDCLTDININSAIDFHKKNGSVATLVLSKVENPLEYGVVVTDDKGRITRFLEKPNWSEVFSDTVNTGIYILNPSVLNLMENNTKYDFSNDIFPILLSEKQPMFGYVAQGYWCDIGDINAYMKCHFDILDGKVNIKINGEQVEKGVYIGKDVQIEPDAKIYSPCFIGEGSILRADCKIMPYSVIGNSSTVCTGASVKQSVIHKNVMLGRQSQIRGSIIAEGCVVGTYSSLFENSVIGEKTFIGDMCEVKNNIKIWPNKNIANETVVSENIVWGDNFSRKLFGENGISGEINVDITPEFATRLGASFGAVKKGKKICVAIGGGGALEMLKGAFVSGLASAGVQVYDFGATPLSPTRRGLTFYGFDGGVFMDIINEKLVINFMNESGGNICRAEERKLETLFMREDFFRLEHENIKPVVKIDGYKLYYMREIINEFSSKKLSVPITIGGNNESLGTILYELGAKVVSNGAKNISADIDDFGEEVVLKDEKGRLISWDVFYAIVCLLMLKSGYKKIVVPIVGSGHFEDIAKKYGAVVLRCKTSKSEIMKAMLENGLEMQFRMIYDAVYAVVKICSFLSENNIKLWQLADEAPKIYIAEREVQCDFGKKGKVIRSMATFAQNGKYGDKYEFSEGVKIYSDKGWVLIIPHSQKPVCKVVSEGQNAEFANELCDFYSDEVTKIITDSPNR